MYFSDKGLLAEFYLNASFFTRALVDGFRSVFYIFSGDILEIFFFKKGSSFVFEGVCLGVRGKGFKVPEVSIIVRNFVHNIGVECIFSYFYNRIYLLKIHDYKKKSFKFTKSKFFFLRERLRRNTKVK